MDTWQLADIPDQAGRTIVVTGPSRGGLGYFAALELARRGARVVLAGRTPAKLEESRDAILAEVPGATLEQLIVDVADLDSVRRAAEEAAAYGAIDVLVNNAGVMATPRRTTTDGLDLQLGTNHFGPFLLTGLLFEQLQQSGAGRVVTVSSAAHQLARHAPLGDPRERSGRYSRWGAYGQSKLANLLFTYELDRRCRAADIPVEALAAHPGLAGTNLLGNGQLAGRRLGAVGSGIGTILNATTRVFSQSAAAGAWPVLMAATADLPGATYVGPGGLGELRGSPRIVGSDALSHDAQAQRQLWELSERTTGVAYPGPVGQTG